MTYVLTREFQPDQLGLHSWGRSKRQLGQISSFGLVSWAWPKGFHFGPAASFQHSFTAGASQLGISACSAGEVVLWPSFTVVLGTT